jgi:hypothetical protein
MSYNNGKIYVAFEKVVALRLLFMHLYCSYLAASKYRLELAAAPRETVRPRSVAFRFINTVTHREARCAASGKASDRGILGKYGEGE